MYSGFIIDNFLIWLVSSILGVLSGVLVVWIFENFINKGNK